MAKVYEIIGKNINTIDELLTLLKENYNEVYSYFSDVKSYSKRSKELIVFVKSQDKELGSVIEKIFNDTSYLHNVLTFIIFELSGKEDIIINNERCSFKDFITKLKTIDSSQENAVIIKEFILNHGITKTFGEISDEENFKENMLYVENNFDNKYVYDYLLSYYEIVNSISSVNSILQSLVIRNEENYYSCEVAFRSEEFLLNLAHKIKKIGPVIDIIRSDAYVFKITKLFCEDKSITVSNQELLKLCSNSFYDWLINHIKEYKYKGKAKKLKSLLSSKLNEYKKLTKKINIDNRNDFYKMVDFENSLFDLYNNFVKLYKDNKIIAKSDDFVLDKEYASTLICQNYVESVVLDLKHDKIHEDPNLDKTFDGIVHYDTVLAKKKRKLYKKLSRFGFFLTFISTLLFIFSLVLLLLDSHILVQIPFPTIEGWEEFFDNSKKFFTNIDFPNIILSSKINIGILLSDSIIMLVVLSLFSLIISIMIKKKAKHGLKNVYNYVAYNNFKVDSKKLTKEQNKTFNKLKKKSDKYEKNLEKNYRITSTIISIIYTLTNSLFLCCVFSLLTSALDVQTMLTNSDINLNLNLSFGIIHLVIGLVLSAIYGILKKSKGFFSFLILSLISLISVIIGCFIII